MCKGIKTLGLILVLVSTPEVLGATFTAIPSMTGARGVSDDGSIVVGNSVEAYSWSAGISTQLAYLPGGNSNEAWDISGNGQIVLGTGSTPTGGRACIWADSVVSQLPNPPGVVSYTFGQGVSRDGSTAVGRALLPSGLRAVSWINGIPTLLPVLSPDQQNAASAASFNGQYVAGWLSDGNGGQAALWYDGLVSGLGDLAGGSFDSVALDISDDGSVVVGRARDAIGDRAFRWANGVMSGLGALPGGAGSIARAVSADGSIVVGTAGNAAGTSSAFIWDAQHGMRSVQDILVNDFGIPLQSWRLGDANGVSADGRFIVGSAVMPNGHSVGWIAEIPEPGALLVASAALLLLRKRRSTHS